MEPRIGMICSSLKLAELTRRVANKLRVQVEVQIATLEKAVPNGSCRYPGPLLNSLEELDQSKVD